MKRIPLIKPYITEEVKAKVGEVLDSGYITEGPVTKDLERAFRDYIGSRHAIAATSCTTGLETVLRALGIGPGDEVIVPDYTYPATAAVVAIVGATPVLVDITKETMLIDYDAARAAINDRTKAILPVSLFGNPLDYEKLETIKEDCGIYVIEDAACALGAEFKGIKAGNAADASVFSLHPRKFITTGEGGMITTSDDRLAAWMDSYKHFGMAAPDQREEAVFTRIGTNYKLSNILAAVGLVQMTHINELLATRRDRAHHYERLLKHEPRVMLPETTPGGVHAYQSFCIFIENRNTVMQKLRQQGIEVQIGTYALHEQPAFKEHEKCRLQGSFLDSRYAFDHCLALPLYYDMTDDDQHDVVNRLIRAL